MEGSTPERADAEDYATLEEVFTSRTFGQALPEASAAAVSATVATSTAKPIFTSNPAIAAFAAVAAAVLVVTGLTGLTVGPGHVGHPLVSAQPSARSSVPSVQTPKSATTIPAGGG